MGLFWNEADLAREFRRAKRPAETLEKSDKHSLGMSCS